MPEIDFTARLPWFAARLAGLAQDGAAILVAEDETGLLGFVTVEPAARRMDQLAVRPGAQGRGVATALIAAAQALSPDGLVLEVNVANLRARRLYARQGFEEGEARRNALSGLPTVVMTWDPTRAASG